MLFYTSRKGKKVCGDCHKVADGVTNYFNKTSFNINFTRWQHGSQSYVMMSFSVASGSVESEISVMILQ